MAEFKVTGTIDAGQLRKVEEALGKSAVKVREAAMRAIQKTTEDARNVAVREVPVDMGTLKQSIKSEYGELEGKIITQMRYAAAVEYGSRPHFPPVEPLVGWVRRNRAKLGVKDKDIRSVAFLIARKISKRGTKARPFMKPAADQAEKDFNKNLQTALRGVLNG